VRGQLYDVRLSTVNDDLNWNRGAVVNYYSFANYGFGTSGTDNNGNLLAQQYWIPGDDSISTYSFMQQNYDYDALNRLTWVGEYQNGATQTGWQTYSYDRWGSRSLSGWWGTGIPGQQFSVDTNTNRLGVPSGQSGVMQYDSNGNLTNDTYSGVGARSYDAENRMVSATNYSNQTSTYTYDADGRRVRRNSYGQETWQVYGMDGELEAEYAANTSPSAPQKEYAYRNGELLVVAEGAASAVNDFSGGHNPNGSWSYGYKTTATSAFTPFSSNANLFGGGLDSWSQGYCCPMITRNATGTTYTYPGAPSVVQPADVLNLHPGPSGEKSVVRWTAQTAGTYTISGRFQGIDTAGTTTDVTIQQNGTAVYSNNINGYGNQVTFSLSVTVNVGDTIDFQVGYGSNNTYYSDSTGLSATITPQSGANLRWLVSDQLGTPRMIADKSGSLAGMSRHDYLPFGEELYAGSGGRTTANGYTANADVREHFTGYERDTETGLDFAQARYYSNPQGRFTSIDPLAASAKASNPQTWNRYSYALNNPLRHTDMSGMDVDDYEFQNWLIGSEMADELNETEENEEEMQQQQDPPPTAVCHTTPYVPMSDEEWTHWAFTEHDPREAIVRESVTVPIDTSASVETTEVALGSTLTLHQTVPLLATGEAAGAGVATCAAPVILGFASFELLVHGFEPRAPAIHGPGGFGISCTAGRQAFDYYHSEMFPPASTPIPLPPLDFGGSWWTCRATGHLTPIPPTQGNGRIVEALGRGPSERAAREAADANVRAFQTPGWYIRHIDIKECWRGR
jgi:RHS repeat-associated protein